MISRLFANKFAEAEQELELARQSMPDLAVTRRYWLSKGRLGYRQQELGEHVAFFLAYQYLNSGDLDRAGAALEPYVARTSGTTPAA